MTYFSVLFPQWIMFLIYYIVLCFLLYCIWGMMICCYELCSHWCCKDNSCVICMLTNQVMLSTGRSIFLGLKLHAWLLVLSSIPIADFVLIFIQKTPILWRVIYCNVRFEVASTAFLISNFCVLIFLLLVSLCICHSTHTHAEKFMISSKQEG